MQVRASLKNPRKRGRKGEIFMVKRGKRKYLISKSNPRLKVRQGC